MDEAFQPDPVEPDPLDAPDAPDMVDTVLGAASEPVTALIPEPLDVAAMAEPPDVAAVEPAVAEPVIAAEADNPAVVVDNTPPSRPHAPRIAVRVIDHPTDWVDGDDAQPRAEGVLHRLPSFDATFFDAPPAEPVTPAEGSSNGMRVHTGAEHDLSFGDFVGGGDSADDSIPDGITAAVRRTAPLTPEVAASARRAVAMAGLEPVAVASTRRPASRGVPSRRRAVAIGAPILFIGLLVMSMLMTHSGGRPKLDAGGTRPSTNPTATTSASKSTAPASGASATTVAPATPAAQGTATNPSAATGSGQVQQASAGHATPSGGGGVVSPKPGSSGGGTHTTTAPPVTHAPPATTPATTPPTVAPPATVAPPTCSPLMHQNGTC